MSAVGRLRAPGVAVECADIRKEHTPVAKAGLWVTDAEGESVGSRQIRYLVVHAVNVGR